MYFWCTGDGSSGPVHIVWSVKVYVRARTNHQIPTDHRRLHATSPVRNRQGQTALPRAHCRL